MAAGKLFTKNTLSVMDAIIIPVIICDENGHIMHMNSTAAEFFRKGASCITDLLPSVIIRDNEKLASLTEGRISYIFDTDAFAEDKTLKVDIDISLKISGGKRLYICTVKDITTYTGLMNSIGRFNSIMENSPASVLITDKEGNIEFFNKNFQHLTGYSFGDLMGKNVSMLKSGFDKKENGIKIRESLGPGESWKGELVNITGNGDMCWVLASIAPLTGKNGHVTGYISVQEDITYLKRIENELKQSQEKFRILFESFPEGIVVTDLSGVILQVNQAYLNIFGYDLKERVAGRNIFDIADDVMYGLFKSLLKEAETLGRSSPASYEIQGDETVYIEFQAVLMTDEKGSSLGYVLQATDYTARKKAETALRESEARNRALIEAIPDIMFRVNNQGVYLDKMLGKKIAEVFPESIAKDTVKYISRALLTREIQIFEYPVTVSGREEFYESRFIAIEDDEVLIILRNVTEKHSAMMQIEEARREAELANRSKSEFLANMSHEIRTPLNSITGFIELLLRSRLEDFQREYLEIIKKSAVGLLEIINDILDFSKIESHKMELNKIPFNPFSEFESIVRLFNVKAHEKGMRFMSFIDPRIPENITSDPLRIKQILSNLLSNAIKFTPEDGIVMIEIGLSRNKDGFCLINFSVSDTGIGIPERKQKQIFEAFAQADSSITRRYGGTGLGLSISSSLARLLGSDIVIESIMGVGSKFYFTVEAEAGTDKSPADSVRSSGISAIIVSGRRNDQSARILETYLLACGCSVKNVMDIHPDFNAGCDIIFFIGLPDTDAFMSLRELKSQVRASVLILDNSHDGDDAKEAGKNFTETLRHPITPGMLINVLGRVSGKYSGAIARPDKPDARDSIMFIGKVLVGEDNSINQKLMMLLLKDYGLEVELAGNGLAVFEKFKKGKYDIILMDINMPAADGFETSRMIREYEEENRTPATPIIALTAKALKGDMEIIMQSGMDDYLSKPVEMDRLESVLMKYLTCVQCEYPSDIILTDTITDPTPVYYNLKRTAAEIKIPVNVLVNIGRDFFEDTAEVLVHMDSAVDDFSYREISSYSHKLKGAAANLRFEKLSELFALLEEKSLISEKEFDYRGVLDNISNEIKILKKYFLIRSN